MGGVQGTVQAPGRGVRESGRSGRPTWPERRVGRTFKLERFNQAERAPFNSRALRVLGKILPRALGLPGVLLAPSRMADGTYGTADQAYDASRILEDHKSKFDLVETGAGSVYVPRFSDRSLRTAVPRAIEAGDHDFAPEYAPIGHPGVKPPLELYDAKLKAVQSYYRLSTQAFEQFRYESARRERQRMGWYQTSYEQLELILQASQAVQLPSYLPGYQDHGISFGNYYPTPNPNDGGALFYVWDAISAAQYQSLVNAENARIAQVNHDLEVQYLRDLQAQQAAMRLQATVGASNTTFDFVISRQKLHKTDFNVSRTRKRKNDKKTDHGYAAFLGVLNRTVGRADEVYQFAQAFYWNIDPVGKASASDWSGYIGPHGRDLRPVTFRRGIQMLIDGRADLNWRGFAVDVVKNEIEDRAYGILGKGNRKLSKLTGRPVGVTFGTAL